MQVETIATPDNVIVIVQHAIAALTIRSQPDAMPLQRLQCHVYTLLCDRGFDNAIAVHTLRSLALLVSLQFLL